MSKIITNKEVANNVRTRVIDLLERHGEWTGTMTDLMQAISGRKTPELFPASPSSLRRIMNKLVPSIRKEGYRVEFSRTTDHERRRLVNFTLRSNKR